jgi:thioredoxin reductase
MYDAIVVGDGPGGLSAALFLAKAGKKVAVFGQDKTAMHAALLYNYLGIDEIAGSDFQAIARRQVEAQGAALHDTRVEDASVDGDSFAVTAGSETHRARYLILSEGKGPRLAKAIGLEVDDSGRIATDKNGLSAIDRVYVVGRSARPGRSQAIISAGDGAAAAIDILSREAGEDVCDWDTPDEGGSGE